MNSTTEVVEAVLPNVAFGATDRERLRISEDAASELLSALHAPLGGAMCANELSAYLLHQDVLPLLSTYVIRYDRALRNGCAWCCRTPYDQPGII